MRPGRLTQRSNTHYVMLWLVQGEAVVCNAYF